MQSVAYFNDTSSSNDDAHVCPQCESGTLQRTAKTDPKTEVQKVFWTCSHDPVCRYKAEDLDGQPLGRFPCPCCGRQLKLVRSKKEAFWACEGWFDNDNNCQTSFENNNGLPIKPGVQSKPTPKPANKYVSGARA